MTDSDAASGELNAPVHPTKRPADDLPPDVTLELDTEEQLRAVSSLVRHRILGVLRDGPATITQTAQKLGLAKGSSSYHLRLLERAGLVEVVDTRKVRGVTERYYGRTSRGLSLPDPAPGEPDVVMRHAVADLEAAPPGPRLVGLTHVRIDAAAFDEFSARLTALVEELKSAADPAAPTANLAIAFYRPEDHR
ncbi:ArsR/SmtB family transcription factor [Kitasatospora sp. LaBMicrA B282]|uniref:ArsR/SmtB family transcription factor n=1 Tax=Kitasatospora sp. LaBMicrA B282 TaxID=3420949 RepID=UPI003D0F5DC9